LLARALELPEADARLAAAGALEHANAGKAVDVLLSDLDDPDRDALFALMQSLGNLTNHHSRHPDTIDSEAHCNECLQPWREFAAAPSSELD